MVCHVGLNDPSHENEVMDVSSKWHKKKNVSPLFNIHHKRIQTLVESMKKYGVHTACKMKSSGFQYTGDGDTACCYDCGLEVSNWTLDMNPFKIHSQLQPTCSFVCSLVPSTSNIVPSVAVANGKPSKGQTAKLMDSESFSNNLHETSSLQDARKNTFSHWIHTSPSKAQMIAAGFFHCNVDDRVICTYCNLICQQWTAYTDDPWEVHKTLSPNCPYVKTKLINRRLPSIINLNENASGTAQGITSFRSNAIVNANSHYPAYSDIAARHGSYARWPNEASPSVDSLVRAGFFYTGTKTIVTCFYCNGSLQNWDPNDNPMIEHVRWFPHCAYARQLCGNELYGHIRDMELARRGNDLQPEILDDETLSKMVDARLDLPISKSLLDKNFDRFILKQCWESQLRLKHDDFVSECDLHMACVILQKQIEHIDGRMENIVIPNLKMAEIQQRNERNGNKRKASAIDDDNSLAQPVKRNACILCHTESKELACVPCGHLISCVPCGRTLRSCPTCRGDIEAFVRILL